MAKRPIFGDVFELKTEIGLAYIQYVNRYTDPPGYGDLVRVLDGVFDTRPKDFTELVRKKEIYYEYVVSVLYPLNKKWIERVGWAEVPEKFKTIPEFRMIGLPDNKTQKVNFWRIWKNGKERRLGKMTEKYIDMPNLGTGGVFGIASCIEESYTPRNDWFVTGYIPEIHAKLREKLRWVVDEKDKNK